ncbi:membrane-associating domain-containing protein [Geopyxis carbonaria]|nr:membrane-associating domain-containing protein [Geopyxis carbonaria]
MNLILPLRIIQTILSFIVLGLSAYCVDVTVRFDAAAFLVFTSVWTFLVLAYLLLTPMFYPDLHNRWAVVGLESITMIFWFAGFVAMANSIDHVICIGTGCRLTSSAKAAAVFGAFQWIAWATSLGLIIHALIQYRKGENADAGNNTTNSTSFFSSSSFLHRKKKEGDEEEKRKDSDFEMGGGGQTRQSYSENNNTPRLPEVAHFDSIQHPNGNPTDANPSVEGHPPSTSSTPFPNSTDFGGLRDDTPRP